MSTKEKKVGLETAAWHSERDRTHRRGKAMTARAAIAVRWLHLYISMLSFSALLFFSWTGITLNHPTWFGASHATTLDAQDVLEAELLKEPLDRLEISETLRERHRLRGRITEFLVAEDELMLVFKGPAYAADVFVERSSGHYSLTETKHGVTALLNDLHKGRDSGSAWSLLIDVTAGVLIAMSLTGFGLLLFLKRRRAAGVMAAFVGTIGLLSA